MYPQVTQFETRERLLRQELQLLRERRSRPARRERPRRRRRLFGLASALREPASDFELPLSARRRNDKEAVAIRASTERSTVSRRECTDVGMACPATVAAVVSIRYLLAVLVAISAVALTPMASAGSGPIFNPPKKYYLALGDSVAYGFQSWKLAAGLPPSGFDTGYVDVFSDRLRTIRPDVAVVNYSCPGETTTSFVAGPCLYTQLGQHLHDHFEGSQLDAAVAFLEAHRGQVSPITLTLWGGDVREFIASCDGDLGCILANAPGEISRIASRLEVILAELRAAAADAEIIVTGAWNTALGALPETDPLFIALNDALERATAANAGRFAAVFPVFNPQGDVAAETAAICTLTLLCTQADSHPSDAGYQALANVVFESSDYARLGG